MSLFTPLRIREIEFPNRIAVSPMCQYSAVNGMADNWHLVHLGNRAVGGAGLVITEALAVEPRGRISPGDLGLWSDDHIPPLEHIAAFLKRQGAVPGVQLAHAGRKASTRAPWDGGAVIPEAEGGLRTVAPSALPFRPGEPVPEELSRSGIQAIVGSFVDAAQRALAAGFEVVEIHSAHGYLAHQFLSPLSNQRTDEYGGSFENRVRFVMEVAQAVRGVWPARLPLFARLSVTDWVAGGWDVQDSVRLSALLGHAGVDLIDGSSGGTVPHARVPAAPGYQVPFAARIRREAGILTGAVGLITEPRQADGIIRDGNADMVLLARELLRDPYWPLHAARALGVAPRVPRQYLRGF
jgi:2,4-dienoyl-CoA reductase-like NADH-dependent reductase (Old Yellow Enzyme family)